MDCCAALLDSDMQPPVLRLIFPISLSSMTGFHATYKQTRLQYYELWFDIDDGFTISCVIATTDDILRINAATVIATSDLQK